MSIREAMEQYRAQLCKAIASLAPEATAENTEELIGPIVRSFLHENVNDGRAQPIPTSKVNEQDDDGVTPLMVACDKAQSAVLDHFRECIQLNTDSLQLIGSPMDSSSEKCGGNCAAHHAASVGSIAGVECLERIQMDLSPSSQSRHLIDLLGQRNSNGDTPIMMAAASGQESFLRHFVDRLLKGSATDLSSSEVRQVFQMCNDSGDTACSLASGFGYHAIILLLIEPLNNHNVAVVKASHDELEKSRAALQRMDNLLPMVKKKGGKKEQDEFSAKRSDIARCVDIMEAALDREAEKQMGELLGEEDISATFDSSKTSPSTKRKAKKKKKGRTIARKAIPKGDEKFDSQIKSHTVSNDKKGQINKQAWKISRTKPVDQANNEPEMLASPRVVTLQDGTVISTNERTTYDAAGGDNSTFASTSTGEETKKESDKSMNDMLRDRCRERRMQAEVEAIMDSLCLDPTMLLLSSHGMALDLSPCQLEAVESILKMQMTAIQEAKTIQARIRSTSEENNRST